MAERESGGEWVELSAEQAPAARVERGIPDAALLLRPRSAPQMLDLGSEVLVARLIACVGICTLIWFPLRAFMPWVVRLLERAGQFPDDDDILIFVGSMVLVTGAQTLAAVISTTAVTLLVHAQLVGRPLTAVVALRRTLRRLLALIGVFLITVAGVSLAGGLFVALGIFCPPFFLLALAIYLFLTWKLSVAPSALVLEDLGVFASIARSWELTRGSFLRWVALLVLVQVLVSGFGAGIQIGDNADLRRMTLDAIGLPDLLFDVVFVAISAVFSGVSTAFNSAAITVFYLDNRIRREGFDLAMRLDRLRSSGAAPGAA